MRDTKTGLQHLISDESGQDLIEYALIAGVMALGSIATLGLLTRNVGNVFQPWKYADQRGLNGQLGVWVGVWVAAGTVGGAGAPVHTCWLMSQRPSGAR